MSNIDSSVLAYVIALTLSRRIFLNHEHKNTIGTDHDTSRFEKME